jgi:hypothetical protein
MKLIHIASALVLMRNGSPTGVIFAGRRTLSAFSQDENDVKVPYVGRAEWLRALERNFMV